MKERRPASATVWFVLVGLAVMSPLVVGCSAPPQEEEIGEAAEGEEPVEAETVPAEAARPSRPEKPDRAEPVASTPEPRAKVPEPVPEIVAIELPAGTILELELLGALDSSVNRRGDEIQARTVSPLYVAGDLVLGEGARVEGRVTDVEASGRVKGRARLAFTFDRLQTPAGIRKVRTSYVEQEAESGNKKDAAVIGGAAGVGAVVGGIIGGKKGAAIGATIGGAGGTGVVLTTKGEEIRLPAGSRVNVRLDEPVVIERN